MCEMTIENAYEQMRNDLILSLHKQFDMDQLRAIGNALDAVAQRYNVTPAELAIAVQGREEAEKLVKTYIVVRGMEGLRPKTLESYLCHLRVFVRALRRPLAEMTANDLRLYLFEYQQARGISNRSLEGVRGVLATFFAWLASEGYIHSNPMQSIKPIKYQRTPRKALSQLELEYLRRGCRTQRETALLEILYSTGCRVSELAGIRLSDIDWSVHTVQLLGKGNKIRTGYLNAKAEVAIKEYLHARGHESVYLLTNERGRRKGQPMGKDNIEKIMRGIVARSRLEGVKVSPHVLRHTTATQAMRSGMPVQNVQRLLGHASVATTMIYATTTMEAVAADHKKFVI